MTIDHCSKWTVAAFRHALSKRLLGKPSRPLESVAVKSWEIAPAEISASAPAYFLPEQLERVAGWKFADEHPGRAMQGGKVTHGATRGFLLRDVWLIDGSLYKHDARSFLSPRSSWLPPFRVECEIDRGALYCSALGNKYFGSWLADDCLTYPLARDEGVPITIEKTMTPHARTYEEWLGMSPLRLRNAFFRELVIFDDIGQNRNKSQRFRSLSDRLLSRVEVTPHPGVFILRRRSGELRPLQNELELAEHLRDTRGFRILDPESQDVPNIVATCAGARTLIGIEGSQLIHGFLVLQPGASVLTLQPPDRFVTVYKDRADRERQHFGFVVGQTNGNGFRIDGDEVERTLDLFPV